MLWLKAGLREGLFHSLSHDVGPNRQPLEGRRLVFHLELRELGTLEVLPSLSGEAAAIPNVFPGGF